MSLLGDLNAAALTRRSAATPMSRRSLLSGLGRVVLGASISSSFWYSGPGHAGASPPTGPFERTFQMSWKGKSIGTHRISIRPEGDAGSWRLGSAVDLRVKLFILGELVYKYQCMEVWRNGRIVELASETTEGGKSYRVTGRAEGNDFALDGPAGPYLARGSLLTTNSLWAEAACAQDELINAHSGGIIGLVAKEEGVKAVMTQTGLTRARVYDVLSPLVAGEFLYDSEGLWIGGVIEKSGQEVKYDA